MKKLTLTLTAAVLASTLFTGCAPLLIGGAMVGGVAVATDRRTSGTQIEDETIEVKAAARIREQLGDRVHINVNSYNRVALITGEARNEADQAAVERIVGGVENVSKVLNEVAVTMHSSLSTRSNDVVIKSKVKAQLIDARDLHSNAFYVVVERGEVFLMGRVTEREAARATEIARQVGGVKKVVRAFEIISEEELAQTLPKK
ncbi:MULTISPECIES: BON domain-containing protein [Roseateles]|uniref:Osmotically-inducible protein OsmY n=1 Tax=Pelomonas aquatica TaxID=431058 RepID=A0ABU1ZEX4_9BURK|nr:MULTISPECIES: BON domain-containing protein [Roseateles]KQY86883.1 transporter [Pelomonas sp. Root1444]MDR7299178.1 osmotically-inducible protein OsmY [Pelomonas aquatica]